MASTVWAARVDPTTPTRLEVQQFAADGTELESFNVTGVTSCEGVLALGGVVVVITSTAFYTYNGSSVSTFTLPTGSYYGIFDLAVNNDNFGVTIQHPSSVNRARYYESADGISWTLLVSALQLYMPYSGMYRYRATESRYLLSKEENYETTDRMLEWTTDHDTYTEITKYYDGTYYLGPSGLLFNGTELYYGPVPGNYYGGSTPDYVVEMTGSTSPTARSLTGVPGGYQVAGDIFALYDYNGAVAALVPEEPTGGGTITFGLYRKSGTSFARNRAYVPPDTNGPIVDLTVYDATAYITAEAGVNGSFRIYDTVSTYTTISGDATYPWLAATVDSDSTVTERFWVEEDDCIETTFSYS
jgi:hypothetical protein